MYLNVNTHKKLYFLPTPEFCVVFFVKAAVLPVYASTIWLFKFCCTVNAFCISVKRFFPLFITFPQINYDSESIINATTLRLLSKLYACTLSLETLRLYDSFEALRSHRSTNSFETLRLNDSTFSFEALRTTSRFHSKRYAFATHYVFVLNATLLQLHVFFVTTTLIQLYVFILNTTLLRFFPF